MSTLQIVILDSCQYWQTVVQDSISGTIGSILAILISFVLYRASTKNSRLERDLLDASNNRNTREYFAMAVKSMLAISKQQLENLEKFQNDIKNDPTDFPLLSYVPMNEFNRVSQSQNLDKVLIAFSSLKPGDRAIVNVFSNLISSVDYIDAQINGAIKQIEKAQMFDHERKMLLLKIYTDLSGMVTDLVSQKIYTYTPEMRAALEKVKKSYDSKKGKSNSLQFGFTEFIIPLNDEMEILYNNGDRDPFVMQLGNMSLEAISIYENMKLQNLSLVADVKDTAEKANEKGFKKLKENAIKLQIITADKTTTV